MLFKTKKEFKVDSQLSHIAFIMDGNGRWAKSAACLEKSVTNTVLKLLQKL